MNGGIDPKNPVRGIDPENPVCVKTQVHMEMVLERDRMIRGLKGIVVFFGIIMLVELGLIVLLIWRHHGTNL